MNIYGKQVLLRAIEYEDSELIVKMFNDPVIEEAVVGWSFPVSYVAHEKWFENNYLEEINKHLVIQIIGGETVGIATLVNIDWKNRRASHGLKIKSSEYVRCGIGTDVVMTIMRYAFEELGFERLDTSWLETNIASREMFKKCGWKEEGSRQKYVYKNGEYKDCILGGILAEEYFEHIATSNYWEV